MCVPAIVAAAIVLLWESFCSYATTPTSLYDLVLGLAYETTYGWFGSSASSLMQLSYQLHLVQHVPHETAVATWWFHKLSLVVFKMLAERKWALPTCKPMPGIFVARLCRCNLRRADLQKCFSWYCFQCMLAKHGQEGIATNQFWEIVTLAKFYVHCRRHGRGMAGNEFAEMSGDECAAMFVFIFVLLSFSRRTGNAQMVAIVPQCYRMRWMAMHIHESSRVPKNITHARDCFTMLALAP